MPRISREIAVGWPAGCDWSIRSLIEANRSSSSWRSTAQLYIGSKEPVATVFNPALHAGSAIRRSSG